MTAPIFAHDLLADADRAILAHGIAQTDDLTEFDLLTDLARAGIIEDFERIDATSWGIENATHTMRMAMAFEHSDDGDVDGWTYSLYELAGDTLDTHWVLVTTDGDGMDGDDTLSCLIHTIITTIEDFAADR